MDKDFESWLKSELSDMKVEPSKDEIVKMFMEFAQVVLMSQKLATDLLTPVRIGGNGRTCTGADKSITGKRP